MDPEHNPTHEPQTPPPPAVGTSVGTLPEPPPAAETVATARFTEREIELQRQIEAELGRTAAAEARAKKAETDASYAADETRRLKEIPKPKRTRSFMGFHQDIDGD